MKKFTLLLCVFVVSVMMPQVVMAEELNASSPRIVKDGTTLTITSNASGELENYLNTQGIDNVVNEMKTCTTIKFVGKFNRSDLGALNDKQCCTATTVDMTDAKFIGQSASSNQYKIFSGSAVGSASTGALAYQNVGNNLYQCSVTQTKSWNHVDNQSWAHYTYQDQAAMIADKDNRNPGEYGRYPTNRVYCQKVANGGGNWSKESNRNEPTNENTTPSELRTDFNHVLEYEKANAGQNNQFSFYVYFYKDDAYGAVGDGIYMRNTPWRYIGVFNDQGKKYYSSTLSNEQVPQGNTHDGNQEGSADLINDFVNAGVTYYYMKITYTYSYSAQTGWSNEQTEVPQGNIVQHVDYSQKNNDLLNSIQVEDWVEFYTAYDYWQLTQTTNRSWSAVDYTDGDSYPISYTFGDTPDNNTGTDGQYAIVGGSEVMYNDGWGAVTEYYDWSQMTFHFWGNSLQIAKLPTSANLSECADYLLDNCNNLEELYKGTNKASISTTTDNNGVTTATVTAQEAGLFRLYCNGVNNNSKYPENTIFQFQNGNVLDAQDLLVLARESAYYYLDLYDVQGGENTAIESALLSAIATMRTQNTQFKGLLLPNNPSSALGTTLIQDNEQNQFSTATCSEFIGRYRGTTTTMHIYRASNNDPTYENRLAKLLSMMSKHNTIAINTTQYVVSTNKTTEISNLATQLSDFKSGSSGYSIVEIFNNEMVKPSSDNPSIYVTLASAGAFNTVVAGTSIENTPNVGVVQLNGPVNADDITAINAFTSQNGPKALDLKNATPAISTTMLNSLTNTALEYIILPGGMEKDSVMGAKVDYSDLTSLKAVISSDDLSDTAPRTLVAYVNVPGSLAEARCLATGNSSSDGYVRPIPQGLTSVILSGNLYLQDIYTSETHNGLSGELSTLTSLDLEKSVFINSSTGAIDSEQMNFHSAGYHGDGCVLSTLILPTGNAEMNTISEGCFESMTSLQNLCIPYNYQFIKKDAFKQSNVYHITTTDAAYAEIDNGPHTYTFSANLKSIGTSAFRVKYDLVTDVYVLAKEAPLCEEQAFSDGPMYWGDGGYDGGDQIYCRDLYIKEGTVESININGVEYNKGAIAICVLHYPDGLTPEQEAKYTDITKVFTKRDQTGAVDADGDPLFWPTRTEMNRVYKQAQSGVLWDAEGWTFSNGELYDNDGNVFFTEPTPKPENFSFKGYVGWHQFVLSKATYVPPVEDDKIERNYTYDTWYSFCIPFDMTEEEVINLMGVPASTDNVINKLDGDTITVALLPDIRTLKGVERVLDGPSQGTVRLSLSENLAVKKDGNYTYYNPSNESYEANTPAVADASRNGKIVIRGGYPYLIKPYTRVIDNQKVQIGNLGESVMKRYEFPKIASSVKRAGCFINQGGSFQERNQDGTLKFNQDGTPVMKESYESPFAKPYEGHEVQAIFKNDNAKAPADSAFYLENGKKVYYKYRFMGQYWEQPLPTGSYYVKGDKWFYYSKQKPGFYWRRYHSIINVSSSQLEQNELFRGDENVKTTFYEQIGLDSKQAAVFKGDLRLVYNDAHDDSFVVNENQSASNDGVRSLRIVFDDAVEEFDEDGNEITAIQMLDGQVIVPVTTTKIYNMKGQYVGNSLDGLRKGLYIVNGKKVVVD